jgi:hypothetical protein
MKNIKSIITIMCLGVLAVVTSCSDDFLDEEIYGRKSTEEFYQTDEDAFAATIAVYDILQFHYNNGWSSAYLVKTLPSDEGTAGGGSSGDQPQYQNLDDYNYDSQNGGVLGAWRMAYFGIYRANKVINNVEPVNSYREALIAEAKALRAHNYFELVSMFGDVPMLLEEPSPEEYNQERAPAAAIYDLIEKDLREAIEVLPLKSQYSAADQFRVSKGTAQSLLGKAYLYQQQWDSAAFFLDEVIASGEYDLLDSYAENFQVSGELASESVFEVQFVSDVNFDWGNFPWDNGRLQESNIHIQLIGPRGGEGFYEAIPGDSLIAGWGFLFPSEKLYNAFMAEGDSVRRVNTVMSVTELRAAGGDWTNENAWDYTGYFRRKYGTYSDQTSEPGSGGVAELNYGTNWRLIRYSDVLLMDAEAHANIGNDGIARTELNKVRERADLPEVTASGAALIDAIVRERQLELAYEGFRFLDLIRWDLADAELSSLGYVEGKHNLYPIPFDDVVRGGLSQNDNW